MLMIDFFLFQIKVVDRTRYKKVYEDIMKKLDRLENDYLPQVSLAQKEVGGLRNRPGLKVIKLFSCSTQLSTKFQLRINPK